MRPFLFLLSFTLLAQSPVPVAPPLTQNGAAPGAIAPAATKLSDKAKVEGAVTNSVSQAPLRKAIVTLRQVDSPPGQQPETYSTQTDAAGKFSFPAVEPGRYQLSAERTGFVRQSYKARSPRSVGTVLVLAPQQAETNANFQLVPQSIITGRVMDEDGEPMANVSVQAGSFVYRNGRKVFQGRGFAQTDDRGEFRLHSLPSGKYLLSATYRPWQDQSYGDAVAEGYATVYYPNATDASAAAAIQVAPGAEVRNIDLRMVKVRTMTISGKVLGDLPDGSQIRVELLSRNGDRPDFSRSTFVRGAQRTFTLRNVPAGSYQLTAMSFRDGATPQYGRLAIEVSTGNVENVALNVGGGYEVEGRLIVEGGEQQPQAAVGSNQPQPGTVAGGSGFPGLQGRGKIVLLMPEDMQAARLAGPPARAQVDDSGSFTLKNVMPGRYRLQVMGITGTNYIKRVQYGSQAVEGPLELGDAAAGNLDLLVSTRTAEVSGTVQNKDGNPVAGGVSVLAIPADPNNTGPFRFPISQTVDQYGRFAVRGLPPGDYTLYAIEQPDPELFQDPDYLKTLEGQGERVTLTEGGKENKTLKLVPTEKAAGVVPRG